MSQTQLSFQVDWYDHQADLVRQYSLSFFPGANGNEVAMFDPKSRRLFLRRSPTNIQISDLALGSKVNVQSRQLVIRKYMSDYTAQTMAALDSGVLVATSPSSYSDLGNIIDSIYGMGLVIKRMHLVDNNGPVLAMDIAGDGVETKLGKLALEPADESLFELPSSAAFDNCALCIIKPHVVRDGNGGKIVQKIIDQGFEVSAMQMVSLSSIQAQELFEVYKGVIDNFTDMAQEMTSAPCIALEVRSADVVSNLRGLCGPHDIELAKHIRPDTIRAQYGISSAQNAVHCTDLETDGALECRYVFSMI